MHNTIFTKSSDVAIFLNNLHFLIVTHYIFMGEPQVTQQQMSGLLVHSF